MKPFRLSAAGGSLAMMTALLLQAGMATNAIADQDQDQDSTPKAAEETAPAPQQDKKEADSADASKESAAAPAKEKIDLVALQAAGYKIVNERGTTLYCRSEDVLNSRLRKKTRCLTAAEIEQEATAARNAMQDMSRNTMNQSGD